MRRGWNRPQLERLETRRLLAQYAFELQLLADDNGQPGAPLDAAEVGSPFFVQVTVEDLRHQPRGLLGGGLQVSWDPAKLEEIDADLESIVTEHFPLLRDAVVDNDYGVADWLSGSAMPAIGMGEAIATDGQPQQYALLHFQAELVGPVTLEMRERGGFGFVPHRDYSDDDVRLEPLTFDVLPADPQTAQASTEVARRHVPLPEEPSGDFVEEPSKVPVDAPAKSQDGSPDSSPNDAPIAQDDWQQPLVGLELLLRQDGSPTPADHEIAVGEQFYLEIWAQDLRPDPQGIGGLSIDVQWDPAVLEWGSEEPFAATDFVTAALPVLPGGTLDAGAGAVRDLSGSSLRSLGQGRPIGQQGPELFARLPLIAVAEAEATILTVTLGESGAGLVGSDGLAAAVAGAEFTLQVHAAPIAEAEPEPAAPEASPLEHDPQPVAAPEVTAETVELEPALIAVATSGPQAGAVQFGTDRGDTFSPLVRPSHPDQQQHIDLANVGQSPLVIEEIQIHAPDVSLELNRCIVIPPQQTIRIPLQYHPTDAGQSFDLADGLVIHSNAANAPVTSVQLAGASTFDADINYDGRVDVTDLILLDDQLAPTAEETTYQAASDPNGDGTIDLGDLGPLNAAFRSALALPTPAVAADMDVASEHHTLEMPPLAELPLDICELHDQALLEVLSEP